MNASISFAAKKGTIVFLQILLSCVFFLSNTGFSQQLKPKSATILQFGDVDTSMNTTLARFLANPRLKCKLSNCTVTGFSFSMLPVKGQYYGPLAISGSDALNEDAKEKINAHGTFPARIFIEDIHLKINGKDSLVAFYTFMCQK